MELKREFSWSLTRYRSFNFCRDAYNLRYAVSWEGWDRYSDERARLAYVLKKLRSLDSWTNQVFRETLRKVLVESSLPGGSGFNEVNMRRSALGRLRTDWHEFTLPEGSRDPGRTGLSEIYYGAADPELVFDMAVTRTFKNISRLAGSGLLEEIAAIPYAGLRDEKNPVSFTVDGLKIWVAPDLVYSDGNGVNVVNFFCDTGPGDDLWAPVAALNVLYACEKFRMPEEKISSRTVFIGGDGESCFSAYSYGNTSELKRTITVSTREMMEFENNSPVPGKTEPEMKCLDCEFRRFCHG